MAVIQLSEHRPIMIDRYESLEECMGMFFDCDPDSLPNGRWEWMDGDRFRVWPMSRVLRSRKKYGTWGWCENKKRLHIWVADYAKESSVMRLLAHEIGHMQRPFKRLSCDEEAKAEQYAFVAKTAYEIMCDLLRGDSYGE